MFLKDIRLILHEKQTMIMLLLIAAVTLIGLIFGTRYSVTERMKMGIADRDGSDYSTVLLSYFTDNSVFNSYMEVVVGSEPELETMFDRGELDLYVVIPEGFTENLIRINNLPIKAVIESGNRTKAVVYKNLLEAYASYISSSEVCCQTLFDMMLEQGYDIEEVREVNKDISVELIFTALGKDDMFLRRDIPRFKSLSLIDYYVMSALALLVMYCGLFAGLSYLKELLSKTSVRLKTTGVSAGAQFLSKLITFTLLYTVLCGVGGYLLIGDKGMSVMECTLPGMLFTMLLPVLLSCMFFMLAARFFRSTGSYYFFSNMLLLLTTVCGGGVIPIMYLPETMARVASFMPNYWFIKLFL